MATFSVKTVLEAVDHATAKIRGVAAGVSGPLGSSVKQLNGLTGRANGLLAKMGKSLLAIGAASAIAASAIAGAALVKHHADAGDEVAKVSRRVGLAASSFQEYRYHADRAGVGAGEFTKGIGFLNRSLGQLKDNSGPLDKFLRGVPKQFADQIRGAKGTAEAYELVLSAIESAPNAQLKAMLSTAFFGKSLTKFVNAAEGGIPALRELQGRANQLGIVMSDEAASNAEVFSDQLTDLKEAAGGLGTQIGSQLLPVLGPLVSRLTDVIVANRKVIAQKTAQVISKVGDAISRVDWPGFVNGLIRVAQFGIGAFNALGGVNTAMALLGVVAAGNVVVGVTRVAGALQKVYALAVANPLTAALVLLAVSAGMVYQNWGPISEFFGEVGDGFARLGASVWEVTGGVVTALTGPFVRAWTVARAVISGMGVDAPKWIGSIMDALKPFRDMLASIGSMISKVGSLLNPNSLALRFFGIDPALADVPDKYKPLAAGVGEKGAFNARTGARTDAGGFLSGFAFPSEASPGGAAGAPLVTGPAAPANIGAFMQAAAAPKRLDGEIKIVFSGNVPAGVKVAGSFRGEPGLTVAADVGRRSVGAQ